MFIVNQYLFTVYIYVSVCIFEIIYVHIFYITCMCIYIYITASDGNLLQKNTNFFIGVGNFPVVSIHLVKSQYNLKILGKLT